MNTFSTLKKYIYIELARLGIEEAEARREAAMIVWHATGCDTVQQILHQHKKLSPEQLRTAREIVEMRAQRVPIQYAFKEAWFRGLPFDIEPGVFIPRPDTETLVDAVISLLEKKRQAEARQPAETTKQAALTLAEIGIGSGAIAVSLLKSLPDCKIFACDICEQAAALADKNARRHQVSDRLEIQCADWQNWLATLPQNLDGIVSNPPYIPWNLSSTLAPEVFNHEPHTALFGTGDDGLDFYRHIATVAPAHLNQGGLLALEVGDGQSDEVCRILLEQQCWLDIATFLDMNGWARVVTAWKQ